MTKFFFFEGDLFRDYFTFILLYLCGIGSILGNVFSLRVIRRNTHLSSLVAVYLGGDHVLRVLISLIDFYIGACAAIRTNDKVDYNINVLSDAVEKISGPRAHKHFGFCAMGGWIGNAFNWNLTGFYLSAQALLELLQLVLSVNRFLALTFDGQYSYILEKMKHMQVVLLLTISISCIYAYQVSSGLSYFDDQSYSLMSGSYYSNSEGQYTIRMIRIGEVIGAIVALGLDVASFVLIRRHLTKSSTLGQGKKSKADLKLAQQMLVNHSFSLIAVAFSLYNFIAFNYPPNLSDAEILERTAQNVAMARSSWLLAIATTYAPAVANVISGMMTIIFLRETSNKIKRKHPQTTKSTNLSTTNNKQ